MMNANDIKMMEQVVNEILIDWNTTITMLTPLSKTQQTSYNPILHEGKITYSSKQIPAERKYIVNNYDTNIKSDKFGDKDEGIVMFAIPNTCVVTDECLFKIDDTNDLYRVRAMRSRIGEDLITLYKLTSNDNIIILP